MRTSRLVLRAVAALLILAPGAGAQTLWPPFDTAYTIVDLGAPANVLPNFGGLTLKNDAPDFMVIGGSANSSNALLYLVQLTRSCGRVTGFAAGAATFAEAPNLDGGLAYGPGDVLFFTRFNMHEVAQILPAMSTMHRSDPLGVNGFVGSVGALQFVPDEHIATGGEMALASFSSGQWARAALSPAGDGSYDIHDITVGPTIGGGPEGIIYVPSGSPLFPNPSILVTEFNGASVVAYDIDSNGDPILATRRLFITGLNGAEGAYIEPATGDFFFSTFGGGNRVIAVRGFSNSCPGDTDGDNDVDFADLNNAVSNFNVSGEDLPGDVNLDCMVSFADLNVIVSFFNNECD